MITIILITILLALLIAYPLKKRTKLPPGPFPFPFLGNLPQVGLLAAKHGGIVAAMKQLKKEYGPVFTIWLGPQPTVHIATMDLAQETMIKRGGEFTQRWVPLLFNAVRKGLGIVGTSGDHWTEQRRFALHTLRNFGLGRSIMEERIMAEVNWRCESIDKEIGSNTVVMSPHDMFDLMVGSIINRMLFSEPLDGKNGEEFHSLKRSIDKFVENVSILDFFLNNEFAFKLPILRTRYQKLTAPQRDLKAFIEKRVKERLFDIESGSRVIPDEPEDYVDAFLLKMKHEEKESGPSSFNVPSLTINLFDLWIAGQETTVTTLISGFAFLLNNLDVIEKIKEELLRVTKGERDLSLLDRPNTPYYNATITEIQRHASILNINLFRRTEEDTYVGGFIVEKGTPLTAEISLLMSDEKFFKDDKFDPTRFLTNDKLDQHVTPFGMGKRSCPGESLARAELYLIIGNMLLRYNIQPTECLPATASKNNCGVLKRPSEYQMRIGKAEGRV